MDIHHVRQRLITTLVAVPITLIIILWPGGVPATIAVGVILTLSYVEYASLCKPLGYCARVWQGSVGIVLLVLAAQERIIMDAWIGSAGLALVGAFVLSETLRPDRRPIATISTTLLGVLWIGGLGSLFLSIRFADTSGRIVLWGIESGGWAAVAVLLIVWSLDIFAYLTGRAFGRNLLAPGLSPKKTVEGAIGGFFAAVITGALVHLMLGISIASAAGMGASIGIAGQAGDLFESAIKREAGVKDSGGMLPGHGGWLDRIDSLLFASVVAALWLTPGNRFFFHS